MSENNSEHLNGEMHPKPSNFTGEFLMEPRFANPLSYQYDYMPDLNGPFEFLFGGVALLSTPVTYLVDKFVFAHNEHVSTSMTSILGVTALASAGLLYDGIRRTAKNN